MADFVVSTTDPDATAMPIKGQGRHLGYHTHYVVDGGKARIIMAVLVTPSEVMENQPMLDFDQRTPFYGQREFQYDAEQNVYRCPQGALLRLEKHRYTERTQEYRADAATCNACLFKAHCTDSECGRSLRRSFDEEYLERVRAYHTTELYHKAMRKRSVWVEPLFAEGKDWHGMRRFRLRLHRPGQLRSPAHRNWTKSQAPAQETRVGTPPIPNRGPLCLFLGPFMWGACSHGGKGRVCGAD
jgi:hypothetical protein